MRVAVSMKVLVGVIGLAGATAALASPPSWSNARQYRDGYDYAQVVNVEPIVRHVRVATPQRDCYDDTRYVESRPHISDPDVGGRTLLGGIIGGVIGHQIGHGRGRDAATVAGAAIGAGVGYDSASRRSGTDYREESVRRCDVSYRNDYEERIDGYRVTYDYNGREYTTEMPYDPGERIRVRVDVAPAE
jgi:uncharacterized protein YcfJ